MADTKITQLQPPQVGYPVVPATDVLPIVVIADPGMATSGSTRKVTVNQLLGAGGTATLASATITGALGAAGLNVTGATIPANGVYLGSANNLSFSAASTLGMTLNSTGLGVGASPANGRFIVGADATTDGNGSWNSTFRNTVGAATTAPKTGIAFSGYWNGTSNFANFSGITGGKENSTDANTAGLLTFWTSPNGGSPTTRMTIDSAGNVGVGVTPSAWGNNFKVVQVGQASGVYGAAAFGYYGIKFNLYNDNTNDIAQTTNFVGEYRFELLNGKHIWRNKATSGTIGTNQTLTDAMTLDASGNLLVGNTGNPNTARAYFRYDTLTTQPVINSASVVAASTSWSHFIGQSGNGSSITTSNIFIYGNGNIQNVNGVYGTISDLRLKENISDARNYLADLLKLRVVKYSLKEEASAVANKLGFIAQEVEQVFPAMVDTDPNDGNKGIKTSVLIPMLVKAIQELTARVEALEA